MKEINYGEFVWRFKKLEDEGYSVYFDLEEDEEILRVDFVDEYDEEIDKVVQSFLLKIEKVYEKEVDE